MNTEALIQQRVEDYFVFGDNNCAMTVLRVLGEVFETPIPDSVINAGGCMPGAGGVGDLCGLLSGALMFVGVWGSAHGLHRSQLRPVTETLMAEIEAEFGSLHCRDLQTENDCGDLAIALLAFILPRLEHLLSIYTRT